MIVMCHCRCIKNNKSITLVGEVENGEARHVWRQVVYENTLNFALNFAVNLKLL